jgi:hypothetical protein
VIGLPVGGAVDLETVMGLPASSRLGGVPSALELAAVRSAAFQRALIANNSMLMQRDAAAFLGSGGSAALAQQQFFAGLAGPSSFAYQQLLMGAGTGLGLSGMKRPADDLVEENDTGKKSTGEKTTEEKTTEVKTTEVKSTGENTNEENITEVTSTEVKSTGESVVEEN